MAKACTVAAARPSNNYGSVPYHVLELVDEASRRKRQRSGSVGEDIVPKKTARMQHREWSTSTATEDSRDGGMRIRQGAKVKHKKCSSEGCTNLALNGGVCKRHGAKIKLCSFEGCANQARDGRVCMRHGAKEKRCSFEGCANLARAGGVCMRHGAKAKRCSSEGCTNLVRSGGVCIRHGAQVKCKLCSSGGCTNQAQRGGVCIRHGAKSNSAAVKDVLNEGCQTRQELHIYLVRNQNECDMNVQRCTFGERFINKYSFYNVRNFCFCKASHTHVHQYFKMYLYSTFF